MLCVFCFIVKSTLCIQLLTNFCIIIKHEVQKKINMICIYTYKKKILLLNLDVIFISPCIDISLKYNGIHDLRRSYICLNHLFPSRLLSFINLFHLTLNSFSSNTIFHTNLLNLDHRTSNSFSSNTTFHTNSLNCFLNFVLLKKICIDLQKHAFYTYNPTPTHK